MTSLAARRMARQRADALRARITKHADVALAVLVVAVVGMMIVPMPTWLLDILLSTNISFSVILLLTAVYVSEPLKIATFPTLLLVTTLFRLALNVSSTRLILIQADAGEVIHSFGEFVVQGNMVVGAVVFLILTLIQFIVIAKGSERVAEVAARFTLDAMPGKQMSIDADLRSGLIDQEEARKRRGELERESQLYGSMDGAMKFVKGDAIAGIIITLINITAGLIIGVSMMGMNWADAAATYSILTIGDGLVSQIPALIISTSAGMIVTRVASEGPDSNLGADIGGQILAQPKAILIAGIMMGLLGLIPGLPTIPFLILGTICVVTAYGLLKGTRKVKGKERKQEGWDYGEAVEFEEYDWEEEEGEEEAEAPREPRERGPGAGLVDMVRVELGRDLFAMVQPGGGSVFATELLPRVRDSLFGRLGVVLTPIRVIDGPDLEPMGYRISIKEVPEAQGLVDDARFVVAGGQHQLQTLGIQAEPWIQGPEGPLCFVSVEYEELLGAGGLAYWSGEAVVAIHLEAVLSRRASDLMGMQQARMLLDALEKSHPDLVAELIPKRVPLDMLAEVLRRLLEEGICVRNLADILESLARWVRSEKDPVLLTEYVRMALRRQIGHRYAGAQGYLPAFLLDPMVEQAVADSINQSDSGSFLAMDPELAGDILEAVRAAVEPAFKMGTRPVILTRMEIRRYVRKLIESDLPDVPVLSFQELDPGLEVRPVGRIGPGGPAPQGGDFGVMGQGEQAAAPGGSPA